MKVAEVTIVGFLMLGLTFHRSHAANILDLMACASPSHHIWHMALVNALAAQGHNVTVLSTDVDPNAPSNVTYVHMEGVYDFMYKEHDVDLIGMHDETPFESVRTLYAFGTLSSLGSIKSNGVKQILAYPNDFKFDLIIYDFTLGPCLLGLLPKFRYPPMVAVTAFNIPSYTVELVGGHNYYAYIPYFALNYDVNMSFSQRIYNIILHAYDYYQRNFIYIPSVHEMAKQVFGPDLPYVGDLEQLSRIALVNSNPAIDFPEPLPPNIIPVGGLQVMPPKPLPADLERFISASPSGAVLFALGTNVRSDKLSVDKQRMLLEAFAQMPEYHFLWKFESESLPVPIPANVLVRPWLPQNDILAHPKLRAFITHAGTLSTHEATWHGVPMVAIPFFVDQVRNSYKSVKAGVAERLPYKDLTTELVVQKVRKVIEDPSYRQNMNIRSARFRDQPEKPLKRAVWWIEYVLRNPNPTHISSPVKGLGPFAANLYDIHLFSVALVVFLFFFVTRFAKSMFTKRNVIEKSRKTQ